MGGALRRKGECGEANGNKSALFTDRVCPVDASAARQDRGELTVVWTDVGSVADAIYDGMNAHMVPAARPAGVGTSNRANPANAWCAPRAGRKGRAFAESRYGIEPCAEGHVAPYRKAVVLRTGPKRAVLASAP